MSYFTAVIAGDGHGWRARDVDVEDAGTLEDLADILRAAAYRDGTVLAVIEREDEWFALVRVDGDDEPRVFVSDLGAATRSPFGDLLAEAVDADVPAPVGRADEDEDDDGAPGTDPDPDDDHEPDAAELATDADPGLDPIGDDEPWAGDAGVLEDLGFTGTELAQLVVKTSDDPAGVLAEVGEACGFGELLDALR